MTPFTIHDSFSSSFPLSFHHPRFVLVLFPPLLSITRSFLRPPLHFPFLFHSILFCLRPLSIPLYRFSSSSPLPLSILLSPFFVLISILFHMHLPFLFHFSLYSFLSFSVCSPFYSTLSLPYSLAPLLALHTQLSYLAFEIGD